MVLCERWSMFLSSTRLRLNQAWLNFSFIVDNDVEPLLNTQYRNSSSPFEDIIGWIISLRITLFPRSSMWLFTPELTLSLITMYLFQMVVVVGHAYPTASSLE